MRLYEHCVTCLNDNHTNLTFSTVEVIDLSLVVTECMSCRMFFDFLSYT